MKETDNFNYEDLNKQIAELNNRVASLELDVSRMTYMNMVILAICHDKMKVSDADIKQYTKEMNSTIQKSMLVNMPVSGNSN